MGFASCPEMPHEVKKCFFSFWPENISDYFIRKNKVESVELQISVVDVMKCWDTASSFCHQDHVSRLPISNNVFVVESVVAGKMTLCECAGTNCTSSLVLLCHYCSHFVGPLFSLGLIIYKTPVASRHISSSKNKNTNQCLLITEPEVDK